MTFQRYTPLVVLVAALLFVGCDRGPKIAQVTGVVTFDGKPVENASVSFYPSEGRASSGVTNAEGKYELVFTRGRKGALLGDHKVTITTEIIPESDYAADDDYESENGIEQDTQSQRSEMLSAKYCELESTILTAAIVKGENVFDFDLKSEE